MSPSLVGSRPLLQINRHFPSFCAKTGCKKHFHDARHSCASLLLKQGVSMKQIQEWLGHSDIATTRKPLSLS
ncbi:MAG TPA: tyrosine-type recombinase/integrase [Candidatus Gemmiger stercorigallinarum]|nr:tyrosine-type recombinase/integrase [Candidatus Gemmiger stercorigallinarum]